MRSRRSRSRIKSYESGTDEVLVVWRLTLKAGHKKFWKLEKNILKDDLGSFWGGMLENRDLESRISNIA